MVRILTFLFAGLLTYNGYATSILPLDLNQLIDNAALVFEGRCIESKSGFEAHNNIAVTYTTFEVLDTLKGVTKKQHTIKQIGGEDNGKRTHIFGIPQFEVGKSYVVFLYGTSQAGFSSPVGLSQGQFPVTEIADGSKKVGNGRDMRDLLQGILPQERPASVQAEIVNKHPVKDMDLEDFKSLVRRHPGASK